MPRKIAAVTGTRAEYGIIRSVLRAIQAHPGLELALIVTGMHLSREYGHTIDEILEDGFDVDAKVDMLLSSDTGASMARGVGLAVIGMADALERIEPDLLMITGDRGEMLSAAIAAAHINVPTAHLHGGEVSGTVDESIRHATTKLSHIHFAATEASAERIRRLGENPEHIFVVGAAGLDEIVAGSPPGCDEVCARLGFDPELPLVLLTQHPVTTEIEQAEQQMRTTLEALDALGYQTVIVYPNSDAGGRRMTDAIKEYRGRSWFRGYPNIGRQLYLAVMSCADVMVGNSSSGIIEAPLFGLPFVCVGTRQVGRERGSNVIEVGHDSEEIASTVRRLVEDAGFRAEHTDGISTYGDGHSGERIARLLAEIPIVPSLVQKKISY
ncbi:MAG: UDP-N-acetylglucosamine 2-epimerase (hydrolyzing) [Actinobacteria bacterium]|nr:MAG: UDP-N-acetylglucosamine 2-epimerase (hydrolyzing) [Actinomycetota bacterium]